MASLATFLRDELPRRGWSIPEWAPRAKLSLSNAYLIVRDGKDNVRRTTFEDIAASFDMTPAELAISVYGRRELSADQVAASAAIEQMSADKRPVAIQMLWGLAVQPAQRATTARADASAKRGRAALRNLDSAQTDHPETGPSDGLRKWYEHPGVLATFLNLLSPAALMPSAAS